VSDINGLFSPEITEINDKKLSIRRSCRQINTIQKTWQKHETSDKIGLQGISKPS
jgi:hypothetical protein